MDFVHATDDATLEFREYAGYYTLSLSDSSDEVIMTLCEDEVRRIGYRLFTAIGQPMMPCPDEECYYHDGD